MKRVIYITEEQLNALRDKKKEVTFYEFLMNTKELLKDLLTKPSSIRHNDFFSNNGIDTKELVKKMREMSIIKCSDEIKEIDIDNGKKQAKRFLTYKIPRANFYENMKKLYKDVFKESLNEEGEGGATSCGSVMQGGGSNPDAGQFITPISPIQRKKFWKPTLKRNKDSKNGSISMNRQS